MQDWTHVADAGPDDRRFLRPAWFEAWDTAFGGEGSWRRPVRYIPLEDGGEAACILPLSTQRIGALPFASLCGSYFPSRGIPYRGAPERLAFGCIEALRAIRPAVGVRLGPVRASDPMLAVLMPALERAGWKLMRRSVGTDFILDNPGGLEAYQAGLSGSRRRKVDYYWRKMNEAGTTELRHFNDAGGDWPRIFADIRAVEASSWVARTGEPRFFGKNNGIYWKQLTQDAWFSRAINVWLIYHQRIPVSFALTLDSGRTRYVIANSYDERVAQYRTGSKIFLHLIFDAFENGIERINIGLGDSGYKSGWGARPASPLVDVVAFPPSLRGRATHAAAQVREAVRRRR